MNESRAFWDDLENELERSPKFAKLYAEALEEIRLMEKKAWSEDNEGETE